MKNVSTEGLIRDVLPEDAGQICKIYNHYVSHTIITFEEEPVTEIEIKQRIEKTILKFPWIIYANQGEILGYAYASEWKSRSAYKHSVESTVYLKKGYENHGIGSILYDKLIQKLRGTNIHAVIGGIALPNATSVALHEKFGFEKIGQFNEVGYKFNQWIDVGYWELIF